VEKVIGDGKWMHHQHDYLAKYYYLKWKGWGYCDSTWFVFSLFSTLISILRQFKCGYFREIYDPEGGMQHLVCLFC
jgi:hypothetical protein